MSKQVSCDKVSYRLFSLFQKAQEENKLSAPEGVACALACIIDSLESRIEYLEAFKNESAECRLIEYKSEINSLISVLEDDISKSNETTFDKDFEKTINEYLINIKEIYQEFLM